MRSFYDAFLKLLPENCSILDAGCGSGRDSLYFKNKGYSVTAMDYSEELVKLAKDTIKQDVHHMSFQEINWVNKFDGIWACASLLHVNKSEISDVLLRLSNALRQGGILYASFKRGKGETDRTGRLFNNYTYPELKMLLDDTDLFKEVKYWESMDIRKDREDEPWCNMLLRRK